MRLIFLVLVQTTCTEGMNHFSTKEMSTKESSALYEWEHVLISGWIWEAEGAADHLICALCKDGLDILRPRAATLGTGFMGT